MPSAVTEAPIAEEKLVRGLGLLDSTMLVAGSMIGSGIFIVSADIARLVGSPGWLLVVWAVTGVLTIVAALSYGELAEMMLALAKTYPEYRKNAAKVKLVETSASKYYGKGYQDVRNRVPKIDNTMKELGWKPKVDMKTALKHIFDAYRGQLEDARALAG